MYTLCHEFCLTVNGAWTSPTQPPQMRSAESCTGTALTTTGVPPCSPISAPEIKVGKPYRKEHSIKFSHICDQDIGHRTISLKRYHCVPYHKHKKILSCYPYMYAQDKGQSTINIRRYHNVPLYL